MSSLELFKTEGNALKHDKEQDHNDDGNDEGAGEDELRHPQ
jgi:hypothetical protein